MLKNNVYNIDIMEIGYYKIGMCFGGIRNLRELDVRSMRIERKDVFGFWILLIFLF